VHLDDRLYVQRVLDEAMAKGSDFSCEYRIVLPDGSVKHVQGKGRHINGGSDGIDRYIGTPMDITERKRAEEELRRSEASLRKVHAASKSRHLSSLYMRFAYVSQLCRLEFLAESAILSTDSATLVQHCRDRHRADNLACQLGQRRRARDMSTI
jgi:PAS domain-containing protein